jgi:hypothetical protein
MKYLVYIAIYACGAYIWRLTDRHMRGSADISEKIRENKLFMQTSSEDPRYFFRLASMGNKDGIVVMALIAIIVSLVLILILDGTGWIKL